MTTRYKPTEKLPDGESPLAGRPGPGLIPISLLSVPRRHATNQRRIARRVAEDAIPTWLDRALPTWSSDPRVGVLPRHHQLHNNVPKQLQNNSRHQLQNNSMTETECPTRRRMWDRDPSRTSGSTTKRMIHPRWVVPRRHLRHLRRRRWSSGGAVRGTRGSAWRRII